MKKIALVVMLFVPLILTSVVLQSQSNDVEIYYGNAAVAREVLVKFRPVTRAAVDGIIRDYDIVYTEGVGDAVLMRSSRRTVAGLVRELSARPEVEYAEPNYIVYADIVDPGAEAIPNDPSFSSLYGLHNTGQIIQGTAGIVDADIDAAEAWNVTTGSRSVVVASIDSGVGFDHSDLGTNAWRAPTAFTVTVGGVPITCPQGTTGFNAITNTCGVFDDNSHGTHTAGTMGATGNNAVGVAGVNWEVSIIGCKFLSASGSGSTANAVQCAEWIRKTRRFFGGAGGAADVVATNNSWGGGGRSFTLQYEINSQAEAGILFVASAGNSSTNTDIFPHFPSSYRMGNIISVAATNNRDVLAGFSNFGFFSVDLGAPGASTLSTVLNNGYGFKSGTSMASPHVTGALALVKAACPSLDKYQLRDAILNNVDPVASLNGKTKTGGRLNVAKAIQSCATPS